MARQLSGVLGTKWRYVAITMVALLIGMAMPVSADLTVGGTVVTSLDPSDILVSGLNGVTIKVEGAGGNFETTTATNVVAGLWTLTVPEGTYTVTPCMTGKTFEHVTGSTPDGNRTWDITVDQDHLAENQSIKFLASDGVDGVDAGKSVVVAAPSSVGLGVQSTITITARDVCENPLEGIAAAEVVVSASPAGAGIIQPTTATDASGQTTATFSSSTSGTYTISVTISGVAITDTATIEVEGENELEFTAQPAGPYQAAEQFGVEVTVNDDQGSVDTSFTGAITIALATNPGGATLSGSTTLAASSGVATFSGLSLNKTGAGYTLTASATGATSATSAAFTIEAADAAAVQFVTEPGDGEVGIALSPSPQVGIYDGFDNLVSDATELVTIQLTGGPGDLSGTTTVSAVSGVATFSDLEVSLAGSSYQLVASSGSLTTGTSQTFEVTAEPHLVIEKTDSSDPVDPNTEVTYTITYGNTGAADATNTVIVEVLPAELTFASVADGGVYEAATRTITWSVGTLSALTTGEQVRFAATVDSSMGDGGTVANANLTIDCDEIDAVQAATETTTVNDIQGPGIVLVTPSDGDVQVPLDSLVAVRITDGNEVDYDGDTVQIYIEGDLVYDGDDETSAGVYDSTARAQAIRGLCKRTGTATDYSFTFVPETTYNYEKKLDVVVTASDGAGNETNASFYFWTTMRSFGANARVNSDAGTLAQDNPATVTDSQGNIWVVWDQTSDDGDTDVYMGSLAADANAFTASVPVAASVNNECRPAIAVDANDLIYVAWAADDPNGHWDVYVSSSSDGTTWATPVLANVGDPNNTSDQTKPSIGVDVVSPYTIYVAYEDDRAGNSDIWVATSTDGTAWSETQITSDSSDQTDPVVGASDPYDEGYVLWTDARNVTDTTGVDIYGAGPSDSWVERAIVGGANDEYRPATTALGTAHALWVQDSSAFSDVLYGNDANGVPMIGAGITDEPNLVVDNPAIAVRADAYGTVVYACWEDARNVVSGNGDTDIYFAEGTAFGTNLLVNDDDGANIQAKPAIGVDGDGNPYMVWVDGRNGDNDIYYAGTGGVASPLTTEIVDSNDTTVVKSLDIAGLQVEIPKSDDPNGPDGPDALPDGLDASDITISELSSLPDLPPDALGLAYDFGPSGTVFSEPVTIRIPITDTSNYSVYKVYMYDPALEMWTEDGIHNPATKVTDTNGTYLEVQVDHFTWFSTSGSTSHSGGGGGCSLAPWNPASPAEFMLPFVLYVFVLCGVTVVDRRRRLRRKA